MKILNHSIRILSIEPAFYSWITGILLLSFLPTIPQTQLADSHNPTTQSFVGTWKVYFVEADNSLRFSHNEEYKANHEFSQWNSTFSLTGRWWSEGNRLFVRFDFPAKTICGDIEFQDDNTFYYLEVGYPRSELLVNKRQMPTQKPVIATRPTAAAPRPTAVSPAKTTKPSSTGFEEYVEREACNYCSSTGGELCKICWGSGKQKKEVVKNEYGKIIYKELEYPCSFCEGKGRKMCFACNGQGYKDRKKMRPKQH
ncbi:MAG: hypothetical protein H7246_06055 [Phycisphaerae bacterium]|nr:hypothetical protein [Saprospiraceae bacterium]